MIVTIDGPAGTGKSTVARRLAEELGFDYLDTGAMYRMLGLKVVEAGVDPTVAGPVAEVASTTSIELADGRWLLDGVDVTDRLRTPEVTLAASLIAQISEVRRVLVDLQREFSRNRNVVCEGRDQGTVVFPHAEFKFFLTAQPEERARRRHAELASQGQEVDFATLLREQTARDQRDEVRAVAPLRAAADARQIDTTNSSIEDVVAQLVSYVNGR